MAYDEKLPAGRCARPMDFTGRALTGLVAVDRQP
jgi:hypothetical protein